MVLCIFYISNSELYIWFKVVIIIDWEQIQKSAKNAKNATDLPETLQVPSLCCFHNLDSQNAGPVDVKKELN